MCYCQKSLSKQCFCTIRPNFQRCDKSRGSSDLIQNMIYSRGNICLTERAKKSCLSSSCNMRGLCHEWPEPDHGSRRYAHTQWLILLHSEWSQTSDWEPGFSSPPPAFSSVRSAYNIAPRAGSVMWLPVWAPRCNPGHGWRPAEPITYAHNLSHSLLRITGHSLTHTLWPVPGGED